MDIKASASEDHGVAALAADDLKVLSVGISTGGVAEIRMAEADQQRRIIATTIDKRGAYFARNYIAQRGYDDQIEVREENVVGPLPYEDGYFDFVYARLVLHYLPVDDLESALAELRCVLKPGGRIFIVVRSVECTDATRAGNTYDPQTHLTTCLYTDTTTGEKQTAKRYFHTDASIRRHVERAGFKVVSTDSYEERLYSDFMRTAPAAQPDHVIELIALRES